MKVKIFNESNLVWLEEAINNWFDKNPGIRVFSVEHGIIQGTVATAASRSVVCIFYENPPASPAASGPTPPAPPSWMIPESR